jgi:hypothetical protein
LVLKQKAKKRNGLGNRTIHFQQSKTIQMNPSRRLVAQAGTTVALQLDRPPIARFEPNTQIQAKLSSHSSRLKCGSHTG